jgi:hypothetical protein
MPDHGIDHRGRASTVVDRPVGDPRWDAHQHRFVLPQGDPLEPGVLEHHQVEGTPQQDELIGLVAMTEQLPGLVGGQFGDQGFVARLGLAKGGAAGADALQPNNFHLTGLGHGDGAAIN